MKDIRLVIKKPDGINHEITLQKYCGGWYDSEYGNGYTKRDAFRDLIKGMETEAYMLESMISQIKNGQYELKEEL